MQDILQQLTWLSVDFNNWKDWEGDSDEELGNFDNFPEGGDGDMAFNTQEAMAKVRALGQTELALECCMKGLAKTVKVIYANMMIFGSGCCV